MSNLKRPPLPLTDDVVAKLGSDRPAYGRGIVRVPLLGKVNMNDRPVKESRK